jgi:putative transposase
MIRTRSIPCTLSRAEADALNRESGRVYTETLVWHWRVYRRQGLWLSSGTGEKLGDFFSETTLHAHSRDAAQQGFYKACRTAGACRKAGLDARCPWRRKRYRTTIWKNTGIRVRDGSVLLARARGLAPISFPWSGAESLLEVRLVYDQKQRRYFWHLVLEDGQEPPAAPGDRPAAIDLGEIHPVAITDGEEVGIFSCRELRSVAQRTDKELARIAGKRSRCQKGSRRMKRLNRAKRRFLARQKRRRRDLEHKVSRATIDWCRAKAIGMLHIGDVRRVADRTKAEQRLGRRSR